MNDPNSSDFLTAKGMTKEKWRARWKRHFMGTCACYVPKGQGINGTRESGKDCEFSKLSGRQQSWITDGKTIPI